MTGILRLSAALLICVSSPLAASAHVTLEQKQAAAGSFYKAVLRVPHGCAGQATKALRVRIPDGFVAVKPMPKAGWTLSTVKAPYGHPYQLAHATVTEGVREVSWSGPGLPDDQYDEFVLTGTVASDVPAGSILYFPAVQECDGGTERWIEVPSAARPGEALKSPAPALQVTPAPAK